MLKGGLICEYLYKKMAAVSDVMGVSPCLLAQCQLLSCVACLTKAGDSDLCAICVSDCTCLLQYMKHNASMPVSADD